MILWLAMAQAFSAFPQNSRNSLEKKKDRLEKSIEYTDLLIDDSKQKTKSSLHDLTLLQVKINSRKNLIDNYRIEQSILLDTIFGHMMEINTLSAQLQELKDEYSMMIRSANKNQNSYNRLLYILASSDVEQAVQRFAYYKHYAKQRNTQIETLKNTEAAYLAEVEKLDRKADQNQLLLDELKYEQAKLEEEIDLKNTIIKSLNIRVKQLIAEQRKKKKSTLKLEERIAEIIAEDNLRTESGGDVEHALKTPTPELNIHSEGFNQNHGTLPWPLERGIISSTFGEQSHPDLAGVKINNNGINFLSHQGAMARSVFKGKVTRVLSVPNFNNVVILRHGEFLTVYSNLAEVSVTKGMTVETKQEIGTVFTNQESTTTELHFEIWHGKTLLDPSDWITSEQQTAGSSE